MHATTLPTTTASGPPATAAPPPRPAPLRVVPVADDDARRAWGALVAKARHASVFHTPDWCEVVAAVFRHRPLHLLALRGSQPAGVLPIMEVDSLLGGRMHISVPYGTYGGVVADDPGTAEALGRAAARQAEQRGAGVLELRSAEADVAGFEPVPGYLGFRRALPERVSDVPASLPKRARAAARHARDRDGVTIEHDPDQLAVVWELYSRSMRRIASINYPYRFFVALRARFGEQFWVSVAWQGKRPLAGTVSLTFGDTLMPYVLGVDERYRCDGVSNLLYGSVMERAVERGLRWFDYGRSRADNAGAVGFKKNQGFEPQPLGYQRYVPPGRVAPDLRPSNPRYALARRVWQRLPLPLTRALGAWLSRSLPG